MTQSHSKKEIGTLIEDINKVLVEGVEEIPSDLAEEFGKQAIALLSRFKKKEKQRKGNYLRPSNLGYPDRKLWLTINSKAQTTYDPSMYMKFFFGDLWELVMLTLSKLAGHEVEDNQRYVDIEGVKGSMDARIDGVTLDFKSASKYSFEKKFKGGGLLEGDDPYGYMEQIAFYANGTKTQDKGGAFLAVNKETAEMHLLQVPAAELSNSKERIRHVRDMLEQPEPPETRCSKPFVNKFGHKQLTKTCEFCPCIATCWKDDNFKAYRYAFGDIFLVEDSDTSKIRAQDVTQEYINKEKGEEKE